MYGIGGPSAGIGGPLTAHGGLETLVKSGAAIGGIGVGVGGSGDPSGELETETVDKVNERALAVVQRIQTKLTGRDFCDANGVLSVSEQVRHVEGWLALRARARVGDVVGVRERVCLSMPVLGWWLVARGCSALRRLVI